MTNQNDAYTISKELMNVTPIEVFVEAYKNACVDSVYTGGTPDENLIAEWYALYEQGRVTTAPPYDKPAWMVSVEDEESTA